MKDRRTLLFFSPPSDGSKALPANRKPTITERTGHALNSGGKDSGEVKSGRLVGSAISEIWRSQPFEVYFRLLNSKLIELSKPSCWMIPVLSLCLAPKAQIALLTVRQEPQPIRVGHVVNIQSEEAQGEKSACESSLWNALKIFLHDRAIPNSSMRLTCLLRHAVLSFGRPLKPKNRPSPAFCMRLFHALSCCRCFAGDQASCPVHRRIELTHSVWHRSEWARQDDSYGSSKDLLSNGKLLYTNRALSSGSLRTNQHGRHCAKPETFSALLRVTSYQPMSHLKGVWNNV